MTPSPYARTWERAAQRRRERAQRAEQRRNVESLGFLLAAVIGLGLALLAAALSHGAYGH